MNRFTLEALHREGLYGLDEESIKWLKKFLNRYVPHVDPYDDESWVVDDLKLYAPMIRIAVYKCLKHYTDNILKSLKTDMGSIEHHGVFLP